MKMAKIEFIKKYLYDYDYNGDYYIGVTNINGKKYKGLYVNDFFTYEDRKRFLNKFSDLEILDVSTKVFYQRKQDNDGYWHTEYHKSKIVGLGKINSSNMDIFIAEKKEFEKEFKDEDFIKVDDFYTFEDEKDMNDYFQ